MKIFCNLLFFFIVSTSTQANDSIIGGLSARNISINTTFTGSDILIFGAIKRGNHQKFIPSDIIIEVLGPDIAMTVRRKKKIFGIWVNTDPIKIDSSPAFYSILSTNKVEYILNDKEQLKSNIGKNLFFDSQNVSLNYIDAINAQLRIRTKDGFYTFNNPPIEIQDNALFSASIALPSNLTEGDYKTKIYLIQNGKVINTFIDTIQVRKIGLEKWLYQTAHNSPFFYSLLSILLALFSGWGASAIFRKFYQ